MTPAERMRRSRAARAQERAQEAEEELHKLRERVRELEAVVSRLRLDDPTALQRRAKAPAECKETSVCRATMSPTDHNVEDVIRGVRAIARALKSTPAQVRELQARQGLPVFLSSGTLCARWSELASWLARQSK